MLPVALVVRTEHKLLGNGVHLLALFQLQVVGRHIVLIHLHAVIQKLVAGGRGEEEVIHIVADAQTSVEHIALVAVHNRCRRILHRVIGRCEGRIIG